MSTVPIKVNAVTVKKDGEQFLITLGASNGVTTQWDIGMNQALLLVVEIEKSIQMESVFE